MTIASFSKFLIHLETVDFEVIQKFIAEKSWFWGKTDIKNGNVQKFIPTVADLKNKLYEIYKILLLPSTKKEKWITLHCGGFVINTDLTCIFNFDEISKFRSIQIPSIISSNEEQLFYTAMSLEIEGEVVKMILEDSTEKYILADRPIDVALN